MRRSRPVSLSGRRLPRRLRGWKRDLFAGPCGVVTGARLLNAWRGDLQPPADGHRQRPGAASGGRRLQANELGQVLILEYHTIGDGGGAFVRSPQRFRDDLLWLYEHDFYLTPIRDYFGGEIGAPAGKRPVVLTFDDGVVTQFRYTVSPDGEKSIDPDSAIGVLEAFIAEHPDFGRAGLFSILPRAPFAWPDAPDQLPFAEEKLRWLLDHGYEIGNHTLNHANLGELSAEEVKEELASAVDMVHEYVPDAPVEVIALPFGAYPRDKTLLQGFEYQGKRYSFSGALMIGAGPAPSPAHPDFDPLYTPRIQATDEELATWFAYVEENPSAIYVSDGDPETTTPSGESALRSAHP
jgi:peptidoglycan/xylan/chitin deacetylase (PgdA/CDA1 family)